MLDRPTLPLQIKWTEAEDAILRAGRDSGLSSSQIAHKLGKPRNAVIGRAGRLGLPRLASNEFSRWKPEEDAVILNNQGTMSLRKIASILGNRTENAVKGRRNKLALAGVKIERRRPPMPIRVKVKAKLAAPRYVRTEPSLAPESRKLRCEELTHNTCRYIEGEPTADATYCGHPVDSESSFCGYHHSVVWFKPTRKILKNLGLR